MKPEKLFRYTQGNKVVILDIKNATLNIIDMTTQNQIVVDKIEDFTNLMNIVLAKYQEVINKEVSTTPN
jgi:hypothetical protein